jgi:hypothetical protein
MRNSLFERIGDQGQYLLILVQQQHDTQIAQPLIRESWTCDQLQAFYLTEMRWRTEHMDVQKLRDIVMALESVFFSERSSDCCRLLLD